MSKVGKITFVRVCAIVMSPSKLFVNDLRYFPSYFGPPKKTDSGPNRLLFNGSK
jgi:hypothetical protein